MEQTINLEGPGVLFANEAWVVRPDGLEHRQTGYFIEREVVGARRGDGLWEWPLQLAPKRWYAAAAFQDAFRHALDRFGIAADARLAATFAQAFSPGEPRAWDGLRPLGEVAVRTDPRPSARRALGKRAGALPAAARAPAPRRLAELGL